MWDPETALEKEAAEFHIDKYTMANKAECQHFNSEWWVLSMWPQLYFWGLAAAPRQWDAKNNRAPYLTDPHCWQGKTFMVEKLTPGACTSVAAW